MNQSTAVLTIKMLTEGETFHFPLSEICETS